VNNGYMDKVDLKKVVDFEAALQAFAKSNHADFLKRLDATPKLTKEVEAELRKVIESFVATGTY
jgi:F-type H+-transporting ATPase subunit alpha